MFGFFNIRLEAITLLRSFIYHGSCHSWSTAGNQNLFQKSLSGELANHKFGLSLIALTFDWSIAAHWALLAAWFSIGALEFGIVVPIELSFAAITAHHQATCHPQRAEDPAFDCPHAEPEAHCHHWLTQPTLHQDQAAFHQATCDPVAAVPDWIGSQVFGSISWTSQVTLSLRGVAHSRVSSSCAVSIAAHHSPTPVWFSYMVPMFFSDCTFFWASSVWFCANQPALFTAVFAAFAISQLDIQFWDATFIDSEIVGSFVFPVCIIDVDILFAALSAAARELNDWDHTLKVFPCCTTCVFVAI